MLSRLDLKKEETDKTESEMESESNQDKMEETKLEQQTEGRDV